MNLLFIILVVFSMLGLAIFFGMRIYRRMVNMIYRILPENARTRENY